MLNFNIRSSFTTRLIVGSLIALFLLSIPVAITAHWILRNNTINQAGVNALAQTEQIAQSVDRHLKEHLRDLVYTSRIEQSFGNFSAEEQTKLLQIMRDHTPGYLWIGVAAPDDLPPQLMFVHAGQTDMKEVRTLTRLSPFLFLSLPLSLSLPLPPPSRCPSTSAHFRLTSARASPRSRVNRQAHWHRQVPGLLVSTARDFNILKPANVP